MDFFTTIGVLVFFYYLINVILWVVLDSDIELWYKQRYGKPISSLKGKVVWITGASSGIGKQLAITLAKNNVKLCLSDLTVEGLEAVKAECLQQSTELKLKDILALKMDMLDIDAHQRHFDTVFKYFGVIDVLVNNAGRAQRASFKDIELPVDRDLFELDVFSIVNLTRIYLQYCNGRGHVVVTASIVGLLSVPNSASYTAAKHALIGYFETLQLEQPEMNVTIFCPGPTYTKFLENSFTAKVGGIHGEAVKATDRRMPVERCAFLMATAIANQCELNFIGIFPFVALIYITRYYPNLGKLVLKALGKKGLQRLRDSNTKI